MNQTEHVVVEETRTVETDPHAHTAVHAPTGYKEQVARAVAVIGLIAILLLGAWGIIQIAFNLPNVFGGIGGLFASKPAAETLTLMLPTTATSGEPFQVSWTHANKGSGSYMYSLSYTCTSGLTIKAPAPNGSLQSTTCATPFNYTNAMGTMTLTPTVKGASQVTTTVTVSAIALQDGSITATKTGTITVLPERSKTTTTTAPARTTSTNPQNNAEAQGWAQLQNAGPSAASIHRAINPNGLPDLAVSITDIIPLSNNLYSVRFVVENDGTNVAQSGWNFSAQLPVGYDYTYNAGPQQALYPGDRIMYSLTFSGPTNYNNCNGAQYYPGNPTPYYQNGYYGTPTNSQYYQYQVQYPYQQSNCYTLQTASTNQVVITVDPQGLVSEITKGNNTATAVAPIGY